MGGPKISRLTRLSKIILKMYFKIRLIGVFLFMCNLSYSADYFVRMGANGAKNGKNWKDAYTDLPLKLNRGSTYYIADGVYKGRSFDDAESGTERITIKKAITGTLMGCHGNLNDTTWDDSYGDGTAIFTHDSSLFSYSSVVWRFTTGYYTLDGQIGSDTSGYGFKLQNADGVFVPSGDTTNNLIFRHIEMQGDGWLSCSGSRGFQISGAADNCTLQYCYVHDYNQELVQFAGVSRNILMENCYLLRCSSGCSEKHSVMFWSRGGSDTMNVVIRNNIFENMGRGGGTGYISLGYLYSGPSSGYEIYGNIFRSVSELEGPSRLLGENGDAKTRGIKFFHNTIVGLRNNGARIAFKSNDRKNNLAYNNLFVDCETYPYIWAMDTANNSINVLEKDVFTDPSSCNYRLTKSIDIQCNDLGAPYNIDPDGNIRGKTDKVIEPGAYEFIDKPLPPAPIDVHVIFD